MIRLLGLDWVSILVLMEDVKEQKTSQLIAETSSIVSILVLMEDVKELK